MVIMFFRYEITLHSLGITVILEVWGYISFDTMTIVKLGFVLFCLPHFHLLETLMSIELLVSTQTENLPYWP